MANDLQKRYSYAYDVPGALSGGMTPYGSVSQSQPGGTVAQPRAGTGGGAHGMPLIGAPGGAGGGGQGLVGIGSGWNTGGKAAGKSWEFAPTMSERVPRTEPSPYEAEYRQTARGWEAARDALMNTVLGIMSPQGAMHYGPAGSYWKGELDKQLGQLADYEAGKRADVDARFRAGAINSAQRDLELERLDREIRARRASASSNVQSQRVQAGMQAQQQAAATAAGLHGNVPVAAEPKPTEYETLTQTAQLVDRSQEANWPGATTFGGGGGGLVQARPFGEAAGDNGGGNPHDPDNLLTTARARWPLSENQ